MRVYVVFCPDGFEGYEMDKIFHSQAKAYEYIMDKQNWLVEEWVVE